nr:MAG: rep protein [Cressdnaviricota sp.]
MDEDIEYVRGLDYKYILISDLDYTQDGQVHRHCFIQFKNARRKFPGTKTAHWEAVNKDIINRINYAKSKGNNYFEDGDLGINSRNTDDWRGFVEVCKVQNPRELIDGPFSRLYAQYQSFAGTVHNQFAEIQVMDGDLEHEWWWGEPGSGKTSKAWKDYPGLYVKSLNKWWDGYSGQEVVLLDDWDPRQECLTQHLKIWADRYPFRAETKGSSMMIRPRKIIITSNYPVERCFTLYEDQEAIRRSTFPLGSYL